MQLIDLQSAPRGMTVALVGEPGVGKTFQARYLGERDLFVDLEGGTLSIRSPVVIDDVQYPPFRGRVVGGIRQWDEAADLLSLLTGPDPLRKTEDTFSTERVARATAAYPRLLEAVQEASVIFVDSLTWLCRLAYEWAENQPSAWTSKGGRPVKDVWAVYRLLADEMVRLVRLLQMSCAVSGKTVVMTALLERDRDMGWSIALHGQRTGEEMRAVFDEIVVLKAMAAVPGGYVLAEAAPPEAHRFNAFICGRNPWGLPSKDRSSKLPQLMQPRLDQLVQALKEV